MIFRSLTIAIVPVLAFFSCVSAQKVKLDLYEMSLCPHCAEAERVIHRVIQDLSGYINFDLYYVADLREDGTIESLRGEEEVNEDLRRIAIWELYAEKFWDYTQLRNVTVPEAPWQESALKVEIAPKQIEAYIESGKAEESLRSHISRTDSLKIFDSPTIYIDGKPYEDSIERFALLKAICARLDYEPLACKSVPTCSRDADCLKEGYIGTCLKPGTLESRCIYEKTRPIPLTIVYHKDAHFTNEAQIVQSTKVLFPGVRIRRVSHNSYEGKLLIIQHNLRKLPAYIFGEGLLEDKNFPQIKSRIYESRGVYLIFPEAVGASVLIERERTPGRADIFVSSVSSRALGVIRDTMAHMEGYEGPQNVYIHYVTRKNRDGELVAGGGRYEVEESIRQLVVNKFYAEKYPEYIRAKIRSGGSSYWEETVEAVGLDPDTIKAIARSETGLSLLKEDARLSEELGITGEIVFLIDNQELVTIAEKEQLQTILNYIFPR